MCKAYFASPQSLESGKIFSGLRNDAAILRRRPVKTSLALLCDALILQVGPTLSED